MVARFFKRPFRWVFTAAQVYFFPLFSPLSFSAAFAYRPCDTFRDKRAGDTQCSTIYGKHDCQVNVFPPCFAFGMLMICAAP
jgi:hypothetical protein